MVENLGASSQLNHYPLYLQSRHHRYQNHRHYCYHWEQSYYFRNQYRFLLHSLDDSLLHCLANPPYHHRHRRTKARPWRLFSNEESPYQILRHRHRLLGYQLEHLHPPHHYRQNCHRMRYCRRRRRRRRHCHRYCRYWDGSLPPYFSYSYSHYSICQLLQHYRWPMPWPCPRPRQPMRHPSAGGIPPSFAKVLHRRQTCYCPVHRPFPRRPYGHCPRLLLWMRHWHLLRLAWHEYVRIESYLCYASTTAGVPSPRQMPSWRKQARRLAGTSWRRSHGRP